MNWRTQPMSGPPLTVLLGVRLLSFMFVWLIFGINIAEMSGMTNDWWFGNQIYVFHVGIFNAVIKVRRHKITLCFWLSRVTRRFSSSHWSIPWMSPGWRWYSTSTTHCINSRLRVRNYPISQTEWKFSAWLSWYHLSCSRSHVSTVANSTFELTHTPDAITKATRNSSRPVEIPRYWKD